MSKAGKGDNLSLCLYYIGRKLQVRFATEKKTKASKLKLLKRELERFLNSTSKIQDAQIFTTHLRNVQFTKGLR